MVRAIRCCLKSNFHTMLRAPSTWMLLAYVTLLADLYARGIRRFCAEVEESATGVYFVLFINNPYRAMLFVIGIFMLFLNIPFISNTSDYEIPRMGRRRWLAGQTVYLLTASGWYVMASEIICALLLLPRLKLSLEWGRVFTTLARTSAGTTFAFGLNLDYGVFSRFAGGEAVFWNYVITTGVCFFFANLLFTLHLWAGRLLAFCITGVGILLPVLTDVLGGGMRYILSPLCWVQFSRVDRIMTYAIPSLGFVMAALFLGNILLFVLNIIRIRRFEWKR